MPLTAKNNEENVPNANISTEIEQLKKENADLNARLTNLGEAFNKLYTLYSELFNKYLNA